MERHQEIRQAATKGSVCGLLALAAPAGWLSNLPWHLGLAFQKVLAAEPGKEYLLKTWRKLMFIGKAHLGPPPSVILSLYGSPFSLSF